MVKVVDSFGDRGDRNCDFETALVIADLGAMFSSFNHDLSD